jgi:hypothetical protein
VLESYICNLDYLEDINVYLDLYSADFSLAKTAFIAFLHFSLDSGVDNG